MCPKEKKRFRGRVLERFADLILRHVYQSGGRERYVPVREIEDELGLEPYLIVQLCRSHLLGEVQVAWRAPVELEESGEFQTPVERQVIRDCFAQPHLRIRPELARLTPEELVKRPKKKRKKEKKKKRRKNRT
ncbi:MAG: hypothetical protein ACYTF8_18000 [Planctomycetota bacterium]|jgi:hypothetical protein